MEVDGTKMPVNIKLIYIPQVIVSIMLLWALYPGNPYGYYVLLRWVCCGVFAYLAIQALNQEKQEWVWILAITAIIYNPIFRVHLGRDIWSVVNVATIGVAIASVFSLKIKLINKD